MIDPTNIDFNKVVQSPFAGVERNNSNKPIIYLAIGLIMGLAGFQLLNHISETLPKNAKRN